MLAVGPNGDARVGKGVFFRHVAMDGGCGDGGDGVWRRTYVKAQAFALAVVKSRIGNWVESYWDRALVMVVPINAG